MIVLKKHIRKLRGLEGFELYGRPFNTEEQLLNILMLYVKLFGTNNRVLYTPIFRMPDDIK